ncbi:hypothetical protein ACRXCV_00320 (plasmid) [Halobacteriovorax sp. GFR7]|uniref:hypothetical protein n=1 Tax=unclassified Halobacteriovorax TaxID=2639665 RepID=UPI003D959E35
MDWLTTVLEAYQSSWVSGIVSIVSSSVAWYLYLRLRGKVKAQEIYKGQLMDEATDAINSKRASGKTAQAYQMGILAGLNALSNLVIKEESDHGRKDA